MKNSVSHPIENLFTRTVKHTTIMHSFLRTRSRTNILEVCRTNDVKALKLLLQQNWTNADCSDAFTKRKPLHVVAESNSEVLLKLLLEQEVDINSRDSQGATPLHLASLKGHLRIVRTLLEYGAKINPRKLTSYSTPLHLASASEDCAEVVEYLCKQREDLVDEIESSGRTALHLACRNGCTSVVNILMGHGADVSRKDNDGLTPIQVACTYGHVEIVSHFVNKVEDSSLNTLLHSRTRFGNNALDVALIHKKYKCADIIMKARNRCAVLEEKEQKQKREREIAIAAKEEERLATEMKKLNEFRNNSK